jgi:5-methylcytosine-specific restriction protein A
MRARRAAADEQPGTGGDPPVCPLCERPIPSGARSSRHHLTPKLKGGARGPTVLLHRICHRAIHAHFAEAELARRLNGVEALRSDPDLAGFIAWIRTKPADFHAPTALSGKLRGTRRAARLRG